MKKGFTLIELLAVIVILGLLAFLVLPNLLKLFGNSMEETMNMNVNAALDAANLAMKDLCNEPISGNKKGCLYSPSNPKGLFLPSPIDGSDEVFVCINDLKSYCATIPESEYVLRKRVDIKECDSTSAIVNLDYFTSEIKYNDSPCYGFVTFQKDKNGKYGDGKAYVYCPSIADDGEYDYSNFNIGKSGGIQHSLYAQRCGYDD